MAATAVAERKPDVNPHTDPGAYLIAKGWRCLGNPAWESAMWLDPEQPITAYYTEEPCLYDAEIREEYVEDGKIKVRYRTEKRQVLSQDGAGGQQKAARRQVFHPAAQPVPIQHALMTQIQRDAAARLAEDKKK